MVKKIGKKINHILKDHILLNDMAICSKLTEDKVNNNLKFC